jgi:hypothetical protein
MATAGDLDADDELEDERPRSKRPSGDGPRKRRRAADDDDEVPVAGGRFLIAAAIIGAAWIIPQANKLGEQLEPAEPEATHVESFAVGSDAIVRITLVTADYNLLGCAAEPSFDGAHCAYKTQTEAWPRDPNEPFDDNNNKRNIVQPYRTWYDNKLVFVAGLWATPEVAFRMHQEPALGVLPEKLARFAVECKLHFVGKFESVKLRWNPQQNWVDPDGPAWVGRATTCKLIDEPQ